MATRFDVAISNRIAAFAGNRRVTKAGIQRVMIILAVVPLVACGLYSAEEITAHVIDAESGKGIAGANIVAAWEVYGGLENGNIEGYLKVMEAVTDESGAFYFPEWGPRPNMNFGSIRNYAAPIIMVFRRGYQYRAVGNNGESGARAPSKMKSDWNGKTIALQAFRGSAAEYKASFIQLHTDASILLEQGHVPDLPDFFCALALQDEALGLQGVANSLYSFRRLRDLGVICKPRREGQ